MAVRRSTYRNAKGERGWVADYRDQHGKRHQPTFPTKKLAHAAERKAVEESGKGTHVADSVSITIGKACDNFIAAREAEEFAPATIEGDKGRIEKYVRPHLGTVLVSRLTSPKVQHFLDDLACSRDMKRRVRNTLSAVFDEAIRTGSATLNPVPKRRRAPRRRTQVVRKKRIPERQEARLMADNAAGTLRPMLLISMFCGLRWGEIRALYPEDIGTDGFIKVRRAADKFATVSDYLKTDAGRRRVPMPPLVQHAMKEFTKGREKGKPLFTNGEGSVLFLSNIQKRWLNPLQVNLGIVEGVRTVTRIRKDGKVKVEVPRPKYRPHEFRHFAVSLWGAVQLQQKSHIDWHQIAEWIGHEDAAFTMATYGHLFDEVRQDHAELIKAAQVWVVGA
jgi:integrase